MTSGEAYVPAALRERVSRQARHRCRDARWRREYEEGQIYRLDLVGWRRETTRERPSGELISIRPDWVAEVLSPDNAGDDLVKKLRTLSRLRVPYCWIVDPGHRTLTVMRWTPDGYLTALTAEENDVVRAEPFDAVEILLAVIFGGEEPQPRT